MTGRGHQWPVNGRDGKVDWDGQHCRFCRFSISRKSLYPPECRIQAGLRPMTTSHLALWAAKAARSWQETATMWQRNGKGCGKNGNV
jgi:hypothetical protein